MERKGGCIERFVWFLCFKILMIFTLQVLLDENTGPQPVANTFIFGENHPFLWLLTRHCVGNCAFSFFCQYLSHLTCGRVHICCVEIWITSRSVGFKNYFAPQFWCAPTFLPLRFFKFFRRILIARMRFTIQMCIQICSSYENKGALGGGGRKPPGHCHLNVC